ncbi:amino acid ABC transporter permease [Pandoraea sputorum]|uniref:Inner membrane amino-acid ABC transporter permease protein yecS n=1 Tax=Pandoraea sputorum TaxID=93222 RepID=A0A239S943_9BURK|nr:amino acid ABC transporter permease [Pandoraea sputorum]AJC15678.1 amino acid ABC transporter permease [Pandoraea sputorum]SNU81133.1 Inner membrane amino-acid ABC transporter permease protein yecS [Pandoraea sputorum]VVD70250.1 amino acid ABC transporter permease [Pandoraea sputorum]VVE80897.1 amino acid ABC transporter permease [Pandoraea sputorum]BET12754.1 amino acid ABC transporter permease [Pandoraea sputorum]
MTEFSIVDMLRGLILAGRWTLALSAIAFVCGGLVALLLLVIRVGRVQWAARAVALYIEVFQGTPLLMQLFLVFFGLPLLGLEVSPWVAAAVCLTLYTSAYLTEIWRGCVDAIPHGQWEASSSLAMRYGEQLRHVILPQALRIAIAPTVGFSVQVVKSTALASIIGFDELTKTGTMLTNATFQPFTVYGLVALLYFAACYPLSLWARHLERKLHVAN